MPEVTQQVVGNEVARCSGPFTLIAPGRREGRRREEGGKEEGSQQAVNMNKVCLHKNVTIKLNILYANHKTFSRVFLYPILCSSKSAFLFPSCLIFMCGLQCLRDRY